MSLWVEFKSGIWAGKMFKKNQEYEINLDKAAQVLREKKYKISYEPEQPPYAAIIKKDGVSITLHYTGSVSICGRKNESELIAILSEVYDCLEVSGCLVKEKGI